MAKVTPLFPVGNDLISLLAMSLLYGMVRKHLDEQPSNNYIRAFGKVVPLPRIRAWGR